MLAAGRHGTPTDPGNDGPATRAGLGTHAGPATHAGLGTPAGLGTRADAASLLGRCAIASGGRSARAAAAALAGLAAELRPREPDRSLQLGAELLMVTTAVPELRGDLDNRLVAYGAQARGHPGYAAIARIVRAQERLLRGGPAGPAVAEVQAALSTELPPGVQTDAVLLALMTLLLGEQYDLASQLLDVALDRARRAGHATREGLILGQRAAIALAQGSLRSAQVEAETGLLLAGGQHFAVLQLIAVAVTAHVERGALGEAEDLASQVAPATIEEDHIYVPRFLVARGQLRIAQAGLRKGSPICSGVAAGSKRWACPGRVTGGPRPPRRWPGWASMSWPPSWPRDRSRWPAGSAPPGRWAWPCAPRPIPPAKPAPGAACSARRSRCWSAAGRGWNWRMRSLTSART